MVNYGDGRRHQKMGNPIITKGWGGQQQFSGKPWHLNLHIMIQSLKLPPCTQSQTEDHGRTTPHMCTMLFATAWVRHSPLTVLHKKGFLLCKIVSSTNNFLKSFLFIMILSCWICVKFNLSFLFSADRTSALLGCLLSASKGMDETYYSVSFDYNQDYLTILSYCCISMISD